MPGMNMARLVRKADLLTFRLFLSVAEEGQLARAAMQEHITPSAVTKRIQEMEELLGIKLFYRDPKKGVTLTAAGQVATRHIRALFNGLERMGEEIGEFLEGLRGQVKVAATESIVVEFLADELSEFSADFPNIDVDLVDGRNPEMLRTLSAGLVDVAIVGRYSTSPVFKDDALDFIEFRTDQLVAVVPNGHPLTQRRTISLKDIVDAGLVGLRPTAPLMVHLRTLAEQAGFPLTLKYEAATNESARALVRAGLGVSIQPEKVLRAEDMSTISFIPLQEWGTRMLFLAVQKNKAPSVAIKMFLEHLARYGNCARDGADAVPELAADIARKPDDLVRRPPLPSRSHWSKRRSPGSR